MTINTPLSERRAEALSHDGLTENFLTPPASFGPVPFWWWTGDPLDRERIRWQLDQLVSRGIRNALVSYNHLADGGIDPGDPPIFSESWWQFFCWTLDECKARGMQLGIQDYCVIGPLLQEIGKATPAMAGAGQLLEHSQRLQEGEVFEFQCDPDQPLVGVWAFPLTKGVPDASCAIDLLPQIRDDCLYWKAPEGEWLVSRVSLKQNPFDPAHPESGRLLIGKLYEPFVRNCPGHVGHTLTVFFQDELDFGSRMPLWSKLLPEEFAHEHGYSLEPWLPALWHDLGPRTVKFRLDYSQTVARLIEQHYFIPVFQWHESHGTLLANDNCGRGGIEAGRAVYGDYFRTMRWYHGPGCDDPNLNGPRAFKGLKVNGSIAHLYRRPKVWSECFHSSGWGTAPAHILPALDENFLYGATAISLHGLYYSTHGSWWEWASPDFHFRQPYWIHSGILNAYISRLCFLLSQGSHVCDVAIVYPMAALEGGLNPRCKDSSAVAFSEAQAGNGHMEVDVAERDAFALGRALVQAGMDFDFVDFEFLDRAKADRGCLRVGDESYRVVILPQMSSVRFSTLLKARDFHRAGGMVIAFGCLPVASERHGSQDPDLAAMTTEIFGAESGGNEFTSHRGIHGGVGFFLPADPARLVEVINASIDRDFSTAGPCLQVLHRRTDSHDIFFVRNPASVPVSTEVSFRAHGRVERWNAIDGKIAALFAKSSDATGTRLDLALEANEAQLIVFTQAETATQISNSSAPFQKEEIALGEYWEFMLQPTMDNRFGDFRHPSHGGFIGAEARQFRCAQESLEAQGCHRSEFDDSQWAPSTFSFGKRFWLLGPLPPESDLGDLRRRLANTKSLDPRVPVSIEGASYGWSPYEFSLRWGIENDPFLKDWASGPHGLKPSVPDEFIDLHCDCPGSRWLLWSTIEAKHPGPVPILMGSRSAYSAWVNGRAILHQPTSLPPGRHPRWNLPHYDSTPQEGAIVLRTGANPLLLEFVQPEGQRVRAYVAVDPLPPSRELALRWFQNPNGPQFNCEPRQAATTQWFRFTAPPGLAGLQVVSRSDVHLWADGSPLVHESTFSRPDGCMISNWSVQKPSLDTAIVAIRMENVPPGSFAGDCLPEPVTMDCVAGRTLLTDWKHIGLGTYSGLGIYRQSFWLTEEQAASSMLLLDLGDVAATASIRVNGVEAGTLLRPPWRVEISSHVRPGENRLEITVANTLASHYSVGIPTPYALSDQQRSGLLGPVRLIL